MISTTDRLGRRRDFVYDELGRLKTEKWYDTTPTLVNTLTFTYDDAGNTLTAADQNGTYTMSYDALNRTEVVEGIWDTTLTFSYDDNGNRTLVVDSEGGTETSTYDPLNRLETRSFGGISTTYLRFDFTYTDRDQVSNVKRYNDLTATNKIGETDYAYDSLGRVENIHHKDGGGSNVSNYTYAYDAGSRVTSEERNGTTTNYGYDNTDQLTSDGSNNYTFDANGNRTMTGYQTGTGNQITNDGTYTYTHDAAGNLTKKSKGVSLETWTYGWDNNNQLTWVEKRATDGGTLQMRAEYKYDVIGNRIEKAVDADGAGGGGTVTTRFAVDGWKTGGDGFKGNENFDVWADLDSGNDLSTRRLFTNGIDGVFARIDSDGTEAWYLADRLGSVREMVDDAGTLQNTITYDGFGIITSEGNSSFGDRYKFTGREWESAVEAYYYRGRWYDSATGRWTSRDPMAFEAGDGNLFRYVHNNSTNSVDPSGYQQQIRSRSDAENEAGKKITIAPRIGSARIHLAKLRNKRITAAYAELYLKRPKHFPWLGLAALASREVGYAIDKFDQVAAETYKFDKKLGRAIGKGAYILDDGNGEVFFDIYWQFLAYDSGGIQLMERIHKTKDKRGESMLPIRLLIAWRTIDRGIKQNKPDLIWAGNLELFRHEQLNILQPTVFDRIEARIAGKFASDLAPKLFPGAPTFGMSVPGGNLADPDDRWEKWIKQHLWKSFRKAVEDPKMAKVIESRMRIFILLGNEVAPKRN